MRRILCIIALFTLLMIAVACAESTEARVPTISEEPAIVSIDVAATPEQEPERTPEPELTSPDSVVLREMKSSKDLSDTINASPIVLDFDGDGNGEELDVNIEYLESNDYTNQPKRIRMVISDSVCVFESSFNDGIRLHRTDFNTEDNYIDFCLVVLGTDYSANVVLYRYAEKEIVKLLNLPIYGTSFEYDEKGNVFFPFYEVETSELNVVIYDYINGLILDEKLEYEE